MSDLSTGGPVDDWKGNAATRCVAYKKTGERCRRQARRGTTVCDWHGAKAPQVKAKARQRLEEAADRMAKELLGIAEGAESEAVKLAAVKHVLAVGGLSEKRSVDLDVAVKPYETLLGSVDSIAPMTRAESRARRGLPDDEPEGHRALDRGSASEPIDAEVVYERPMRRPEWAEDGPADPGRGFAPPAPSNGPRSYEDVMDEIAEDIRRGSARGTRIREIGR